jgi:hypothetical protein
MRSFTGTLNFPELFHGENETDVLLRFLWHNMFCSILSYEKGGHSHELSKHVSSFFLEICFVFQLFRNQMSFSSLVRIRTQI